MDEKIGASAAENRASEVEITPKRLDELIRWHGTDESALPPAHTLQHLARDTIAALRELARERETIARLRAAIARAFWTSERRTLNALLLEALGPPPEEPRGGGRGTEPQSGGADASGADAPRTSAAQAEAAPVHSSQRGTSPRDAEPRERAASTRLDAGTGRGRHHPGASRPLRPRVS